MQLDAKQTIKFLEYELEALKQKRAEINNKLSTEIEAEQKKIDKLKIELRITTIKEKQNRNAEDNKKLKDLEDKLKNLKTKK